MNKFHTVILIFLIIISARAAENPGAVGFQFLRTEVGARPAAMAGSFLAVSGDVNAIYYNPAGISSIEKECASFTYLNDLLDFNTGFVGYVRPKMFQGTLGVGILYKDYGNFKKTDMHGQEVGDFGANSIALCAAYGRNLYKEIKGGISLKYVRCAIDNYTSDAIALDMGVMYYFPTQMLSVAAGLFNAGYVTSAFVQTKDDLPLNYRLGFSKRLAHLPLLLCVTAYYYNQEKVRGAIGGEFTLSENLIMRLGYDIMGRDLEADSSKDRLAGAAIGLGVLWNEFRIDYSFTSFGVIGSLNRFSLSGNF